MRGYDDWLVAPMERQMAEADAEAEAWDAFCEARNGPYSATVDTILGPRPAPPRTDLVPPDAFEEDHPDHAIYKAWLALEQAIQDRWNRMEAEEELENARQEALDRQHELYDYDGL